MEALILRRQMNRKMAMTAREHMEPNTCDREHEFALVLSEITKLTPEILDALFEAGCDDATPSIRNGRMYMTFSRTARSLKDAILSAIRDVKRANIGTDVMRVDECDLVTQADIARRIGRTRQLVSQYISGERGDGCFPPPACELNEKHPLWLWCEVAYWLHANNIIKEDALLDARQKSVINTVLDLEYQLQQEPELTKEILAAIRDESEAASHI